jgi:hypothetical protein
MKSTIDIPMRERAILAEVLAVLHLENIHFTMVVESGNYIITLR